MLDNSPCHGRTASTRSLTPTAKTTGEPLREQTATPTPNMGSTVKPFAVGPQVPKVSKLLAEQQKDHRTMLTVFEIVELMVELDRCQHANNAAANLPASRSKGQHMNDEDAKEHLAAILARHTPGSILQLLAEVMQDTFVGADAHAEESLGDAIGTLITVGLGIDLICPWQKSE